MTSNYKNPQNPLYYSYNKSVVVMSENERYSDQWFIQFDNYTLPEKTFSEEALLTVTQYFCAENIPGPPNRVGLSSSHYLINMAEGLKEVVRTLYSFFIVEEKLTVDVTIKQFFSSLVGILKTQISYAQLFFVKSEGFIFYRLMACLLRGIKFYTFLYNKVELYKHQLDQNFFGNMKEVFLYMMQRFKQVLGYKTEAVCFLDVSKLQRLIIHMLNILIVCSKYPVKEVVFNQIIEQEYVREIFKYNQKYLKFRASPDRENEVSVQLEEELDPVLIQKNKQQQQYY